MTDSLFPVKTTNGHDFLPPPLQHKPLTDSRPSPGVHAPAPVEADDGQINCVCGYFDDDGYSVACDLCNRWQHMVCYYPIYENRKPPDDMQHFCIECRPRDDIDVKRAQIHQQKRLADQDLMTNGTKRVAPKSHKKKVKDVPYTNGWPLDKARHDRNSASPRDLPPPAKRPKTSHRTSDPANSTTKGHNRKRTATSVSHRRSLSRSPESPIDLYSEEFLRSYREDDWAVTNANLHDSIAIANELSSWLNASEEEFFDKHGQAKGEALMRWDGEIEDIPGKAQLAITETHDSRVRDENDNVPMWKTLTVQESVAAGAYLGELKGHIGFKEEYQRDPASRWPLLRHPEPFVFIHPRLPIYIDARTQGTELRYVRRSCQPNARLQILVTGGTTYHFCFMATEQIDPGMEIAVGWDTLDSLPDRRLPEHNNKLLGMKDIRRLSSWVTTVLANCGPCACQHPDQPCLMARFDRRGESLDVEDDDEPTAKPPPSKKKKTGQHMSPLNTNFNSRSGSEARKVDQDDEHSDSRSASGSVGRGSASRDITPNTHYSHTGSLSNMPEMSERERKKLAKEEEIFRRQEEEKSGKVGKKKRNSAGSALSTPNATSSKQLGFGASSSKYADAGTSKQTGLPSVKPGRKSKASSDKAKASVKTITKIVKRPKPDYVDAQTQCDMDGEEAEKRAQASPPPRRFISTTQRLLHRCAVNNTLRRSSSTSRCIDEKMDVDVDKVIGDPQHDPLPVTGRMRESSSIVSMAELISTKTEPSTEDVEMKDSNEENSPTLATLVSEDTAEKVPLPSSHTMPPPQPPSPIAARRTPDEPTVPPWPSQQAHTTTLPNPTPDASILPSKPAQPSELHIQMPPPPTNPFAHLPPALSTGTPSSSSAVVQSPASLTNPSTLLSPASAVTPSPAKKKMSLSDYTKRSKAKDKDTDHQSQRDSSPASVASGPSAAPAVQQSATGAAVDADVKMEE